MDRWEGWEKRGERKEKRKKVKELGKKGQRRMEGEREGGGGVRGRRKTRRVIAHFLSFQMSTSQ